MLDYLISLLDFSVNGQTYNLITTPWTSLLQWIADYKSQYPSSSYGSALRDAYETLAKMGMLYSALIIVLIILCTWFVYKIASGFTGWFKFR